MLRMVLFYVLVSVLVGEVDLTGLIGKFYAVARAKILGIFGGVSDYLRI